MAKMASSLMEELLGGFVSTERTRVAGLTNAPTTTARPGKSKP